jgi:hypothetical protein
MNIKCKLCQEDKEMDLFYLKKDGKLKTLYCKECYKIKYPKKYNSDFYEENKERIKESNKKWADENDRKEYYKKYRDENKDILKGKQKEYREKNKDKIRELKKEYWENLPKEEKDKINQRNRENYHKYKTRKNKYVMERMSVDPMFKLKFEIRTLIRNSMRRKFTKKSKKTIDILGCSFEEFSKYLESKFDENMTWENQGTYWHLDHIKPISLARTEEEVYRLNHYTNFQPLFWKDNLIKGNKFDESI